MKCNRITRKNRRAKFLKAHEEEARNIRRLIRTSNLLPASEVLNEALRYSVPLKGHNLHQARIIEGRPKHVLVGVRRLPKTISIGSNRERSIEFRKFWDREDIAAKMKVLWRPRWQRQQGKKNEAKAEAKV